MHDLNYTQGDRVSWHEDDEYKEGVVQKRGSSGADDDALLTILTTDDRTIQLREADVRRVVIPM